MALRQVDISVTVRLTVDADDDVNALEQATSIADYYASMAMKYTMISADEIIAVNVKLSEKN